MTSVESMVTSTGDDDNDDEIFWLPVTLFSIVVCTCTFRYAHILRPLSVFIASVKVTAKATVIPRRKAKVALH